MEILGILLESRPMILYREKTQIRFCINITDTGKRKKMLHFEIRYRDMPFCSVLF